MFLLLVNESYLRVNVFPVTIKWVDSALHTAILRKIVR